ncbi:MAG: hypothetical protein II937_13735 [Bacteroidales bacterium]|nr:hypothetical protein [Bacteroidales bacterium]
MNIVEDAPNTEMTPETVFSVESELYGSSIARRRFRERQRGNVDFRAKHTIATTALRGETNEVRLAQMIRNVKQIVSVKDEKSTDKPNGDWLSGIRKFNSFSARTSQEIWNEYRRMYVAFHGEEPLLEKYQ